MPSGASDVKVLLRSSVSVAELERSAAGKPRPGTIKIIYLLPGTSKGSIKITRWIEAKVAVFEEETLPK